MTILVCPLSKVHEMISLHAPERIVSVLDPGSTFPETGPAYAGRHLRLSFHDVHLASEEYVVPSTEHVEALLAFLLTWERATALLIHCRAGIGRSTATAYIAACLHNPHADELAIARELRRVSPLARPNRAMVGLADRVMKRDGRMRRAIASTGVNLPPIAVQESEPFEIQSTFGPFER